MDIKVYAYILLAVTLTGCKKSFLNAKPSTEIVVPTSLYDLESMLNNPWLNQTGALGHLASDDYIYLDEQAWQSAYTNTERNSYLWNKDIFEGELNRLDWNIPYSSIFYANNVLQRLTAITNQQSDQYKVIKGWALFVRAYSLFDLVKNFAPVYDAATAASDLGVPIRLRPEIDELNDRASVQQTYNQIISDLTAAEELLSKEIQTVNKAKPSKTAVNALLARVYLSMNNYPFAEKYADLVLSSYKLLIDYNTVSITSSSPFALNNEETIFSTIQVNNYDSSLNYEGNTAVTINPEIITLYEPDDLRLVLYFDKNDVGNYYMKEGYFGTGIYPYTGLATDEIYLIKAECLARRGEFNQAMDVINSLLIKRYKTNSFNKLIAGSADEALRIVLVERRKELVWRGLRWTDLKRLNKLGANITLKRQLNGKEYTLPPNDPRYVFPIPDDEISRSGIKQNLR